MIPLARIWTSARRRRGDCALTEAPAAGLRLPRFAWLLLSLVALLCATPAAAETVVVEAGSSMTYLANTSDPGVDATWFLPDFVEGPAWSSGVYGVGHEGAVTGPVADDLIQTEVPGPVNSIYTRTTFTVADAGSVFSLFFGADYDDGAVVWVNGVEVYRCPEMRGWTLAWDTVSSSHESSNGTEPDYEPLRDISDAAVPAIQDGVNVVAIGIWNNTGLSEDLVLVPKVVINRMLRRGPYLQQATPDSVIVRWRTGLSDGSRVLFGTDPANLTSQVTVGGFRTDHEVMLTGLAPNTRYYYAVGTPSEILAGGDAEHFFVTPPAAGTPKPTRVWILGDPGTGNTNVMTVRDAYYDFTDDVAGGGADARNTDLFMMLGDNADPQGTQQQYQENVFEIFPRSLRQSILWPTIGNHDMYDDVSQTWPYYDVFTLPTQGEAGGMASGTEEYYSYDYGNIHFVVLNSMLVTTNGFGDAMLTWLEADLLNTAADWIVAYWHHPPYSKGGHDSDDPADSSGRLFWMRENALPVLEDYGVDLVFTGHSHNYERSYLIDGHYGDSTTFLESMKKDAGDGSENGDGAYVKPYRGGVPYAGEGDGAVYTVAGCASHLTPGKAIDLGGTEPNHPAMAVTLLNLGSVVLDVNGNRLDVTFLGHTGEILDEYTVFKDGPTVPPDADFDAVPRTGQAPLSVSFADLTLNGPTVWQWDVDDDGSPDSAEPAPTFEFTQPGLRSVRLTVENSAGSDEELKTDFVCVISGSPGAITGLAFDTDPDVFAWNAAAGATAYDVIRGDLAALGGGSTSPADWVCLENDDDDLQATDATVPAAGHALFYLAGAANCAGEQGTFDTSGPGQAAPRDGVFLEVCASCATGTDDDGDGICVPDDNCPDVANPDQQDGDSDGVGDDCDGCPSDPAKTDPGLCGCGVPETDSDGDLTPDCVDGCPNDPNKTDPGVCGCGVPDTDTDGDLTPDCVDGCPNDPGKTDPGVCGCGVPDTDTDGDLTPDCVDGCPNDPNKIDPGFCGCGVPETDTDGDLTPDCVDGCPNDPNKIDPGFCGCGLPETDTDGDLTPDCVDGCPNDPGKTDPGVCGCGVPDTDTDGDLTPDCIDGCPHDPDKIDPGVCGCGVPDTDTDGDLTPNCIDGCPADPNKIEPGICGCGTSECWAAMNSGAIVNLESVDFPVGEMTGYAVGAAGTILKTEDGGFSWSTLKAGITVDLETIDFPDDTLTGYAVGDLGSIFRTTDGGHEWDLLDSGVVVNLRGVNFIPGTSVGYAVGDGGTILKTLDGGDTWLWQDSGSLQILESVHFPTNASVGYVVGRGGTILKTVDGGLAWNLQISPTLDDLEQVCFPVDAVTGYAVGDDGTLLKTINGGLSWFAQNAATSRTLRGISFEPTGVVGYIVGSGGVIRMTVSGGQNWILDGASTNTTLRDVQIPMMSTRIIVGSTGIILKWIEE
jgi:photosystem II stability/assembly factor-like uncharacterized protein